MSTMTAVASRKRGPGRPRLFRSPMRKHLRKLVKLYGLTGAQVVAKVEGIEVSIGTLRRVGTGLSHKPGPRPRKV